MPSKCFRALDKHIAKTKAKKPLLLMVLEHNANYLGFAVHLATLPWNIE
jgi:hypothetical protein